MIVIIDYNVGNLKSVVGAFKRIGLEAVVSRDEKVIKEAKGIVLPGVGTFPTAMKNLEKYHLVDILTERKEAGIPILGICLGMQILFEEESWKTGSITPPVFCPYQERCVQNVENLLQVVCGSMGTGKAAS